MMTTIIVRDNVNDSDVNAMTDGRNRATRGMPRESAHSDAGFVQRRLQCRTPE